MALIVSGKLECVFDPLLRRLQLLILVIQLFDFNHLVFTPFFQLNVNLIDNKIIIVSLLNYCIRISILGNVMYEEEASGYTTNIG